MSRVQLALNVSDLDEAVDFYSKLFGTEPAKRRPGYANFAIADPPLKLVLMEAADARGHGSAGALNHLGVEVETTDEVAAASRPADAPRGSRPRSRTRRPAASPSRTRCGSAIPTVRRGRSTPCSPTPRPRPGSPATDPAAFPRPSERVACPWVPVVPASSCC